MKELTKEQRLANSMDDETRERKDLPPAFVPRWEECRYGALGILSKEEAVLEEVVDRIKAASTLEAIGILREFKLKP